MNSVQPVTIFVSSEDSLVIPQLKSAIAPLQINASSHITNQSSETVLRTSMSAVS